MRTDRHDVPTHGRGNGLFPGTSVHKAAIVRASRFAYEMHSNYWALYRLIRRSAVPLHKPQSWWASVRRLGELMAGYKVTCVLLRKQTSSFSKMDQAP